MRINKFYLSFLNSFFKNAKTSSGGDSMAKDVCCHVDNCVYNHDCKCDAQEITVCNCKCNEAKEIKETACETFKCR